MVSECLTLADRPIITAQSSYVLDSFMPTLEGALVVDYTDNPEPYERLYEAIEPKLERSDDTVATLRLVNDALQKSVRFSHAKTAQIQGEVANAYGLDRVPTQIDPIGVSRAIELGGGNCQFQTLTFAAVVNLVQERHGLEGDIAIRFHNWQPVMPLQRSGHISATYSKGSTTVIIDPSEKKFNAMDLSGA